LPAEGRVELEAERAAGCPRVPLGGHPDEQRGDADRELEAERGEVHGPRDDEHRRDPAEHGEVVPPSGEGAGDHHRGGEQGGAHDRGLGRDDEEIDRQEGEPDDGLGSRAVAGGAHDAGGEHGEDGEVEAGDREEVGRAGAGVGRGCARALGAFADEHRAHGVGAGLACVPLGGLIGGLFVAVEERERPAPGRGRESVRAGAEAIAESPVFERGDGADGGAERAGIASLGGPESAVGLARIGGCRGPSVQTERFDAIADADGRLAAVGVEPGCDHAEAARGRPRAAGGREAVDAERERGGRGAEPAHVLVERAGLGVVGAWLAGDHPPDTDQRGVVGGALVRDEPTQVVGRGLGEAGLGGAEPDGDRGDEGEGARDVVWHDEQRGGECAGDAQRDR
jgi:hypothetical protein